MWAYNDVIRANSLFFFKFIWSNLVCSTNFSEIKSTTYFSWNNLLFVFATTLWILQNMLEDFPYKTGFLPPTEHILARYTISSNPLLVANFSWLLKKCKNARKSLRCIMTSLSSSGLIQITIIFLCCTNINRNMHILMCVLICIWF